MLILRHPSQGQAGFVEVGKEPHEGDYDDSYAYDDNPLKVDGGASYRDGSFNKNRKL